MGLLVDYPKSGGSGTTNNGNTARRIFEDSSKSSKITGIRNTLIEKFGAILQTLPSGFEIDSEAFRLEALETANLFVELYVWYSMPATVDKIFVHGTVVLENALLPIGHLLKEAQRSRTKDCKYIRRNNSRKCSRRLTNRNLTPALLISSDVMNSDINPTP